MTRREVPTREDDTLYSKVYSLIPGVIFQVESGAPWLRTDEGVVDLSPIVIVLPRTSLRNEIPEGWKGSGYDQYRVFVIHDPETDEG